MDFGSPPPLDSRRLSLLFRATVDERGFGLVEVLMACVIVITLAAGIAGVLTSAISATSVAADRTKAEQCAADQVEQIRRRDYDDVGVVGGNPPGTVPASSPCGNGFLATANVSISYENDPTPTSYATAANYKKVAVTVTRNRDGQAITSFVTFVSPSSRAPYGGINNAIINATVVDLGTNLAYEGATVYLTNGPSANRHDTTDVSGSVSFAALTPNPTSGAQSYYDLTVGAAPGYQTLAADLPPGTATPPATPSHVQLAPSQTSATSIRVFKPATIALVLLDAAGVPYTGGATIKIASSFTGATTTDSVAPGASSKSVTTLGGEPVIPGATYTVRGFTTSGLCAEPSSSPVPSSGYPNNVTQTFALAFAPCPTGALAVHVTQFGADVSGADVTVTGGPNDISASGTTDSNGNATFTVPEGSGYAVTATKTGLTAGTTASVGAGSTTTATIALPSPTLKTVTISVRDRFLAAYKDKPVLVSVTGGPFGTPGAPPVYTTSPSPATTTNTTPAGVTVSLPQVEGYTYTVKVSVSPCASGSFRTGTSTLSSGAGANNVTVDLTGTLACPYTP